MKMRLAITESSSPGCRQHQAMTASFRATATIATFQPRGAAIRWAKARSGPAVRVATQAASTRTWRATEALCLLIRPWRAGFLARP